MKRPSRASNALLLCLLAWLAAPAAAQLHGVNPFSNGSINEPLELRGLFDLDYQTGEILDGREIFLAGFIVTGINALTIDPTTGVYYAILKVSGVSGRVLVTVDPATGTATQVGNLGDNFSSLSFRSTDGQLFGTTGDGASVPETLYTIDKTTGVATVAVTLGNGADGELIAYNPNDNHFYHWSGNGTIVYERILAEPPYTITNIPILTPGISGESFGAVWDECRNAFLVHDINSRMRIWTTTGSVEATNPATVADVRGLALVGADTCDADLAVTQTDSADPVNPGDALSYEVTVVNNGPRPAQAVQVSVTPPTGSSFVATVGCAEDPNGQPTCSLGDLAAGASTQFRIDLALDAGTLGTITNTVVVASTTPDAVDTANNTSSEETRVQGADLSIAIADAPDPILANGLLTYTVTVQNLGPDDASNVSIASVLPAGVGSASSLGCGNDPAGVPTCQLGTIAALAEASVQFTATVDAETKGTITFSATVGSDLFDPEPGNDSASEDTLVLPLQADLSLGKTNDVGGATTLDDVFTWTLTLANAAGTAAAEFPAGAVILRDQLPDGDLVYDEVLVQTNGGVTGTLDCAIAAADLACTASSPVSVPVGASLTVRVPAGPVAAATFSNPRASGICAADPDDVVSESDEANNDCSDAVLVQDLGVFSDGFEAP